MFIGLTFIRASELRWSIYKYAIYRIDFRQELSIAHGELISVVVHKLMCSVPTFKRTIRSYNAVF